MHQYAVQITVADVRDGACSSSTLKEASSWGKVNTTYEQMVYAEATTVVPLIFSYAYHNVDLNARKKYEWTKYLDSEKSNIVAPKAPQKSKKSPPKKTAAKKTTSR